MSNIDNSFLVRREEALEKERKAVSSGEKPAPHSQSDSSNIFFIKKMPKTTQEINQEYADCLIQQIKKRFTPQNQRNISPRVQKINQRFLEDKLQQQRSEINGWNANVQV